MEEPWMRKWVVLLGLIVVALLSVPIVLSAIKAQRVAFFENKLSVGQTVNDVQSVAAAQGLKIATFYGQPKNVLIFTVSRTWRFGTPCDDVVFENLIFENGRLKRWAPDVTSTCM
jgi:hypothetical protein